MPKVAKVKDREEYLIKCPGCKQNHLINTNPKGGRAAWKFNGDMEKPTFMPSLLIKTGHHVPGQPQPPNCKPCNMERESGEKWPWPCGVCHSFIRNGTIQFLRDCTHQLAGVTVELEDFDAPEKN